MVGHSPILLSESKLKCEEIILEYQHDSCLAISIKKSFKFVSQSTFPEALSVKGLTFISPSTAPKQNKHFISSSMKVTSIYLGEAPVLANLQSAVISSLFPVLSGY